MQHSQQSIFASDQQQENNQADHAIEYAMPKKYTVTAKELAAKYNSKNEVYYFLACDVGVYLPHHDNVTIWFLKDLMNGTKKMIRNTHVRTCHVPQ